MKGGVRNTGEQKVLSVLFNCDLNAAEDTVDTEVALVGNNYHRKSSCLRTMLWYEFQDVRQQECDNRRWNLLFPVNIRADNPTESIYEPRERYVCGRKETRPFGTYRNVHEVDTAHKNLHHEGGKPYCSQCVSTLPVSVRLQTDTFLQLSIDTVKTYSSVRHG